MSKNFKQLLEEKAKTLEQWKHIQENWGIQDGSIINENTQFNTVDDALRILEDAKKEFPDYLMFDPEYSKSDPYITHQKWTLDQKNAYLKTLRDEWFLKWFGGDVET